MLQAGVVGYMTWWNVNLDGVALINLIMCIGFSVDFSAHICYHYMSEDDKTPEERIAASLYALGMPIVQGACSTILGVIGLAFAPSYLYITFFKMVFLVIFLGAAHGLILLPVLLSLFGPGSCGDSKSSRRSAISTPSTTVSVHSTKLSSCYTVSLGLGLGPADLRRKQLHEPTLEHFQKRRSDEFPSFPTSEFHPDRFTFVGGRMQDETLVQGVPPTRPVEPRLAPVPESEEQEASRRGFGSPANGSQLVRREGHRSLEHAQHKKICRSKSHRPRTHTAGEKQQVKEKNVKPPLRKYNSFPYHMFMNEAGYSSDESIKSAFSERR